jgi:uncharacterized protein
MMTTSPMPAYVKSGEKQFLKKELAIYLVLSVILSWPVALLIIAQLPPDFKPGDIETFKDAAGSIVMLYGLGPILSASIVTLVYRGTSGLKELFSRVMIWKVPLQWYGWALILPVVPQWIGLFVWAKLTDTALILPSFTQYLSSWLQITLVATAYYVTEEVGWRGFMLPRTLSLHPWISSSLRVGIIWSVWHYPIWITGWWSSTGSVSHTSVMVLAFSVYAIGLTVIGTWIFKNTSGSILLAMLLHASSNSNIDTMKASAGNLTSHDSGFALAQAGAFSITVVLLLIVSQNKSTKHFM